MPFKVPKDALKCKKIRIKEKGQIIVEMLAWVMKTRVSVWVLRRFLKVSGDEALCFILVQW